MTALVNGKEIVQSTAVVTTAVPEILSPYTMWLESLDVPAKTLHTYTVAIRDFENWTLQNGITSPTENDVKAYKEELASRINERTGKTYSTATVQLYVGTVKRFFKWAAKHGMYADIAADIKAPAPGRAHKKDYLTTKQVRDVLATVDGDSEKQLRDYAIIRLMITTGLRTIEVARANVEDLRTLGDTTVLYVQGKGCSDKSDFVEIPAELEDAIRAYLKARGNVQDNEPLFTGVGNRDRTRMRSESISRIAKTAMRNAGIDDSRHTAHSFRHTAATLNLLNGGTLEETQALLRHANMNTTLIYSHALDRAKNRSASRINAAIFD